jgi:hypothetical protein
MYNFRRGRKIFFAFTLTALLCFLLTLRQYSKYTSRRPPFPALRPLFEDPVELLLTDDDVLGAGFESAQNATLGVSHHRQSPRSNLMTPITV